MYLLTIIKRLFATFTRAKTRVIIAGTDVASYQLAEQLIESGKYEVLYFINEEPWHHRTYLLNAQLRYPNEIDALALRHQVELILCPTQNDAELWREKLSPTLTKNPCKIIAFSADH